MDLFTAHNTDSETHNCDTYGLCSIHGETAVNCERRENKTVTENGHEVKSYIEEESKLTPQERLLRAIDKNDFQTFTEMLKRPGVELNFKYGKPYYTTCIELACRLPDRGEFVKLLLKSGAKPNVHEIHLEPIHYAAREGNPEALEALLQNTKTKINIADSSGRTALHHAVRYSQNGRDEKYEQCIILLLKRQDLDINKPNENGYTAIHEAANSRKEAVELILKYRRDLDLDTRRPTGRTAREYILITYPDLRNLLPESKECYLTFDRQSQLLRSLQRCQFQKFCDMLHQVDDSGNARVDPNFIYDEPHNTTCLQLACRKKNYEEFVIELLNAGADPNLTTKEKPLHLAAELGNYKALAVLSEDRRTNVNAVNGDGKSVMHLITEHDENMEETTMKCLKIVLNNSKININIRDKNGHHPIFSAIQHNRKSIIETILVTAGNRLDIDHIEYPYTVTLREVIFQMYPELQNIVSQYSDQQISERTKLFQLLYDGKLEDFIENFRNCNSKTIVRDYTDGNYTFLQYATLHELYDITKLLLESGVNPNSTTDYEKRPPIVIVCETKNAKILKLFLESDTNKTLNINSTDAKGNTALHLVSKNEDLNSVIDLMKHGANIKHKNVFNKPPLSAKSVEYFLDVSLETNEKFTKDENYEIIFNYDFLVAYRKQSGPDKKSVSKKCGTPLIENVEANDNNSTEFLNTEMDVLYYLSKSDDYKHLMGHPVISSFLHMKWKRVKFTFFINLFIHVAYVVFFNFYILSKVGRDVKHTIPVSSIILNSEIFAFFITGLFLLYSIMTEIVQLSLSFKTYYKSFENIIDISLIVVTGYILCKSEWIKAFVVLGIFLSWTKLILLTGHHPKLSRNIEMLKNVSLNYCWFLFSYVFLIIAFAFSFYSLLHTNVGNSPDLNCTGEYNKSKDCDKKYDFFMNPWLSILKTFIMMMGEFEASAFLSQMANFETSFWLFSLFVFIIAMVLLNLLTGLAVSDTHAIKANADELSLKSHVRLMYEIERTHLRWNRFFHDHYTWKLCYPFLVVYKFLCRDINVFPNSVHSDKKVSVFPNKGSDIIYKNNDHNSGFKDLAILEAAMNIISKRNTETEISCISKRLDHLQETVEASRSNTGNDLYAFQEQMEAKLARMNVLQELNEKADINQRSLTERLNVIETSVITIKNMLSDMKKY